ncbi:MAG: D-cysteine desulfhydrase family protein [Bacteroidia bacterium]|nr:MAG: D-cysteine desulfhydrase family protein [Bacteroidia bacterium]
MKSAEHLYSISGSIPRYNFSLLPTPLHKLENLGSALGIDIYCKRDDLTGFALGGNKTRKLDYIIRDAVNMGADSIVTFGSAQSNWCRMASAAARYMGIEPHLFLAGDKPDRPTANLILDSLVDARIYFTGLMDETEIVRACMDKADELKAAGRNPYFVAVGGSNPIGCTGYINAMAEILDYESTAGIEFSKIFLASGSAGTQAGLVAGKIVSGWQGQIIGLSVSRGKTEQEQMVADLAASTLVFHGFNPEESRAEKSVIADDLYLGEGYRIITEGCREAIAMFASLEGIFLDEVYTGKAAAGLIDWARRGLITPGENVLFIHTGGTVQLFE